MEGGISYISMYLRHYIFGNMYFCIIAYICITPSSSRHYDIMASSIYHSICQKRKKKERGFWSLLFERQVGYNNRHNSSKDLRREGRVVTLINFHSIALFYSRPLNYGQKIRCHQLSTQCKPCSIHRSVLCEKKGRCVSPLAKIVFLVSPTTKQ